MKRTIALAVIYDSDEGPDPDLDAQISKVLGKYKDGAGYGFGQRDFTAEVPPAELTRVVIALKKIEQVEILI